MRRQAIIPTQLSVLGTALTTSFALLGSLGSRVVGLIFTSSCDQEVVLSLTGTTDQFILGKGSTTPFVLFIPFGAIGVEAAGSIYVRELASNVTAGIVWVSIIRSE